ncbi:MAG: Ig-like domain-containing protein [Paracoccaceae bacterium]
MTGTAQPGAVVQVAWNGATLPATVAANGSWSVTFPAAGIAGGTYATTAIVTATDAAGNTATASRTVQVDTETQVSVNAGQSGGDNIVSGAERGAGLALTGHAEPGATVKVTFEGVTRTVIADGNGNWTASYASGEYRAGTYDSTVQVTATDLAGNTATTSHALHVDTEVVPFQRLTIETGADNIVNAAEAAGGVAVTGMVEPGSSVMVLFGSGPAVAATVSANGSWTVNIPASQIPAGEANVAMTITATDAVGNSSVLNETVRVDTLVRNLSRTGGEIGGDGIVNAAEALAGITLAGTVEPYSTVVVRLSNGQQQTVTAGASGNWTATFDHASLPTGEGQATVTMTATDPAGNTASLTETFAYDTVAPGTPEVISFSRTSAGLRGIGTELTDDAYSFTAIDGAGNTTSIGSTRSDDLGYGETDFRLNQVVPDGSYLVIDTRDVAGNETSTLLIVDNTSSVNVDLGRAGLAQFDFAAIDLTFAPDANLTLTAADLQNLTGPDHELIVKGDTDDNVQLQQATPAGSRVIDGHTYDVYTLGTGTVLVDEEIQTTFI